MANFAKTAFNNIEKKIGSSLTNFEKDILLKQTWGKKSSQSGSNAVNNAVKKIQGLRQASLNSEMEAVNALGEIKDKAVNDTLTLSSESKALDALQEIKETSIAQAKYAQRVAAMPNPNEGIEQIQQQIKQDAYWKDQEARIAQIKANVKANPEAEKLESANIISSNTSYAGNIKWDAKMLSANELEMQATEAALENSGKITSTEIQKEQMKRWSVTPGGGMKIETNKPFVPSKTYNVGTPESANGLINTGDEFNIPVVATDGFSPEMLKTDRYSDIATHPRTYSNKYTYENIDRNGYIKPALSKEQMKLQYGSPPVNEDAPWANSMKIALGTAVTGAALCAALSTSRGQQNNAQLYGQQPLY